MSRDDEALVSIAKLKTEIETSLARGALEGIGIPALVPGESSGGFHGMYGGGSFDAELKVFESDRDRALVELRRLQIRIVPSDH